MPEFSRRKKIVIDQETLKKGLSCTLEQTDFTGLGPLHRGKVRDSYVVGDRRIIVVSDRISAFDVVLGTIPFKGQILNSMASYWFNVMQDVAPNHLLAVPDPAVSVVWECQPFAVEMVVRGYLTGTSPTSLWTHYARGERLYCGHRLPEGMVQHQKLDQPLITPTTKAEQGAHDEPISAEQIIERKLATVEEFEQMSQMCLKLFSVGSMIASQRGLILVDTKYELGRTPDGRMVIIDEIHTPDSSRYWYADSYEEALCTQTSPRALDKEFLRRSLISSGYHGEGPAPELSEELRLETARRYIEIYECVTGNTFQPNLEPPEERIRRHLQIP
jgi:phosphoribosylaminoimidazole-succinocarboxamide synthase